MTDDTTKIANKQLAIGTIVGAAIGYALFRHFTHQPLFGNSETFSYDPNTFGYSPIGQLIISSLTALGSVTLACSQIACALATTGFAAVKSISIDLIGVLGMFTSGTTPDTKPPVETVPTTIAGITTTPPANNSGDCHDPNKVILIGVYPDGTIKRAFDLEEKLSKLS